MLDLKHPILLVSASLLLLAACSAEDGLDSDDSALLEDDLRSHSLERKLELFPQVTNAAELTEASITLDTSRSRYLILSTEEGAIDLASIALADDAGEPGSLVDLFPTASPVQAGLLERDALLLLAVPEEHIEALCERFRFADDDAALVTTEGEPLEFRAPAGEGRTHALCLRPLTSDPVEGDAARPEGGAGDLVAPTAPQAYGGGSYTLWVESVKCNDPRSWENVFFDGDEFRLRAFHDGLGGALIHAAQMESGDWTSPNRFIHFNNNVKLEAFDQDTGLWNPSDKLGAAVMYGALACGGPYKAEFDGSGGLDWDYDLAYRVYGPNCTCQSQRPPIYTTENVKTCTLTSQTVDAYTYYCSGGTYWKQAWGDTTRHCLTYQKKYNTACELKTYHSQLLLIDAKEYAYDVPIGNPVVAGTCPQPSPCKNGYQPPSYLDESPELPGLQPLEPECPL